METSTLSRKGQVTIPKGMREAIGLEPGNLIGYDVQGGVIIVKSIEAFDAAFHKALSKTLNEWNSPEDEEAFCDL